MPIRSRLAFGYDRPEIFFLRERKLDDHQHYQPSHPFVFFFFSSCDSRRGPLLTSYLYSTTPGIGKPKGLTTPNLVLVRVFSQLINLPFLGSAALALLALASWRADSRREAASIRHGRPEAVRGGKNGGDRGGEAETWGGRWEDDMGSSRECWFHGCSAPSPFPFPSPFLSPSFIT